MFPQTIHNSAAAALHARAELIDVTGGPKGLRLCEVNTCEWGCNKQCDQEGMAHDVAYLRGNSRAVLALLFSHIAPANAIEPRLGEGARFDAHCDR
jgi:hypothetical protein